MVDSRRFTFNNLQNVEIEISSLCNRKCNYCPQCKIKRTRELFPIDTFEKVMNELKEISYCGGLAFHQYNEPLLEYEHLCKCISIAKSINPGLRLELYTNGDFLTRKRFLELKKMGINRLVITCHLNKDEIWSKELGEKKVNELLKKLKIHKKVYVDDGSVETRISSIREFVYKLKEFGYAGVKKYPFKLQIRSVDYYNNGSSRMGLVNGNTDLKDNCCTYYCYSLMHGFHVSYKGNVYMCCDCCDDVKELEKYIIGSVKEEKIYDIFAKKDQIMKDYMNGRNAICNTCFWNA